MNIEEFDDGFDEGYDQARALFDMAAVAIVKNPSWAIPTQIPSPELIDGVWKDRPENPRKITLRYTLTQHLKRIPSLHL